jgi:hypothetical protein
MRGLLLATIALFININEAALGQSVQNQIQQMEDELKHSDRTYDQTLEPMKSWKKDDLLLALRVDTFEIKLHAVCLLVNNFADSLTVADASEIVKLFEDNRDAIARAAAEGIGINDRLAEIVLGPTMDSEKKNVALWTSIGIMQKRNHQDATLMQRALKKILNNLDDNSLVAFNYLINTKTPEAWDWLKQSVYSEQAPLNLRHNAATVLAYQLDATDDSKKLFLKM